ncbi:MAG TPA: response regulator transcription factor [Marmoricola sp.]|jgi:DNA-binding response OmpR family regulator|nr:response regulator transcription factor [Marmoricola sp.]
MTKQLLLIEDEPRVRHGLGLALEDQGFSVAQASDGRGGLARLEEVRPDVVLLDVMLPDVDGFTVCRTIRRHSDVPVIMVTARTDAADVVTGLEAGADDYVTKPLVARVLSARIRALLRRVDDSPCEDLADGEIEAGDLRIDLGAATVSRDGADLPVTRTEFKLLAALAAAHGNVCSREHLLEQVWGYGYFGDSRIVDVHVRRLRAKIERDPCRPVHVVTARGLGYRLVR